jgi:cytochrome c oxidase assembly factor CtaG
MPHAAAIALLLVGGVLYGAGAARGGRAVVSVPRAAAFALAGGAMAAAFLSPLDRWAESSFWAHMVQHQLLMVVAAPLLVLARPVVVSLGVLPRRGRRRVARWRRALALDRLGALVGRPATATPAFGVALWGWHVPALYEAALASGVVHLLEHASFLGAGALFWHALLRRRTDAGLATVHLFVTGVHSAWLGVLLTFARGPWYPAQSAAGSWALTPLEDQQLAGLVMWVPSGLAFAVAALLLVTSWLADAERRVAAGTCDRLVRAGRSLSR